MNKKQKILLTIAIIFFIGVSFFSVYILVFKQDKNTNKKFNTKTEAELSNNVDAMIDNNENLTDEEKEALKSEDLDVKASAQLGQAYAYYSEAIKIGDDSNTEYPESKSNSLYKQLISLAESADYLKMLNIIEEKLETYKFTEEYNWKIGALYKDATIMLGVSTVNDINGLGAMVSDLKDPYMLAIGTLMIPEKARRDVIINPESISPIFEGTVHIANVEENPTNDTIVEEIYSTRNSVEKIYKMTIVLETNKQIYGYVYQTSNGDSFMYMFTTDDTTLPYRTISYWKSILP